MSGNWQIESDGQFELAWWHACWAQAKVLFTDAPAWKFHPDLWLQGPCWRRAGRAVTSCVVSCCHDCKTLDKVIFVFHILLIAVGVAVATVTTLSKMSTHNQCYLKAIYHSDGSMVSYWISTHNVIAKQNSAKAGLLLQSMLMDNSICYLFGKGVSKLCLSDVHSSSSFHKTCFSKHGASCGLALAWRWLSAGFALNCQLITRKNCKKIISANVENFYTFFWYFCKFLILTTDFLEMFFYFLRELSWCSL